MFVVYGTPKAIVKATSKVASLPWQMHLSRKNCSVFASTNKDLSTPEKAYKKVSFRVLGRSSEKEIKRTKVLFRLQNFFFQEFFGEKKLN